MSFIIKVVLFRKEKLPRPVGPGFLEKKGLSAGDGMPLNGKACELGFWPFLKRLQVGHGMGRNVEFFWQKVPVPTGPPLNRWTTTGEGYNTRFELFHKMGARLRPSPMAASSGTCAGTP